MQKIGQVAGFDAGRVVAQGGDVQAGALPGESRQALLGQLAEHKFLILADAFGNQLGPGEIAAGKGEHKGAGAGQGEPGQLRQGEAGIFPGHEV